LALFLWSTVDSGTLTDYTW